MERSRFTQEEIVGILQEIKTVGEAAKDVCRRHGITEQTLYAWRAALGRPPPRNGDGGGSGLTGRELDVVRFVSKGMQNKAIAAELGISEGTVKIHVHHIYAKLGLSNRVELAVYARGNGIIAG